MKPTHPYKGVMTYYSPAMFGSREVCRSQDDRYEYTYIAGELTETNPIRGEFRDGFLTQSLGWLAGITNHCTTNSL